MSDLTLFPADIAEMSVNQLAALPPAQKAEIDKNLDTAIDWLKKARTKFDAALDQCYGEQARAALRESGRDFGTAHISDGPLHLKFELPKKVTWNQQQLVEIAERYNNKVATLAVAMRSCTHPQNGGTITDLPQGIMEIGMGQHGEGGGGQKPLVSADDTAAEMVDLLCQQLKPKAGDKMMLIINGVGATTHMELNIIFRKAYKELEARGLQVVVSRIQEILTVQEQAGFQMIMAILDEDHIDYLKNKRADAPYWTTIGK